jgi:hypothetical protein
MLIVKSNKKCYKMYDTVNFRLSGDCIDSCNYSKITDVLSGIQENIEVETGKCRITGNFNNYRIILSESSVFISGSLAKFYFNGENQSVLTRIATKDAIQMLQDSLNIPLDKAEIKRIDLGFNFPVKHTESSYYSFLGDANYYDRLEQNNGVYYRNHQKQMAFYGKISEQKKLLPIYEGRHMLRYELRFLNRLNKQLQESKINTKLLIDENFYMKLIERWKQEYFKIYRHKLLIFKPEIMNSSKEFEKQLMALGLQMLGGEQKAFEMIKQAKRLNFFDNKMQEFRLKQKIKNICSSEICAESHDLIMELDKKVNQAVQFYS